MLARGKILALALACLMAPAAAFAQSALLGVVKDNSGGVLPGVVVLATSDAIIEGVKATVTDEEGSYRIIDLRPGIYTVTFTLSGFQAIKIDQIFLAAEQTRTVNGELKLGAVSEALTVSGTAPVVDVQNATRVTSLERAVIDNLPLGNNIWEMAQLIPGIDIYANTTQQASSVGGSYGAVQVYMSTHGQDSAQNVVMVDGMSVSGLELNGTMQAYFNNDMNSEVSYQTSGIGADRSGGGVTVNMIPREGGNRFNGNAKASFRPNSLIADNADRLRTMGLTGTASLKYLADETLSQGGPIVRNKLWFFASFHQFDTADYVDGTFFGDGEQGYDRQRIQQGSIRLTLQATDRTKISGYYDKTDKARFHAMTSQADPETASNRWYSPNYGTGNVKVTTMISSQLLFEGGYSFNREYRDVFGQDGIQKDYGTSEWLRSASRTLQTGGARTTAPSTFTQDWPGRDNYQGSVSYVTGSHQVKAGVQWQTGTFFHNTEANGDLTQRYGTQTQDGFEWILSNPIDVTARNTPVSSKDRLNADIGIYAQDSWRMRRLTLNYGLRWEHLNAQNDAWEAPEGRFVPRRSIAAVQNVPDWYDWAPRFSAVYDVFGNSRTAVKYAVNRYNRAAATALASSFNTLTSTTRTLSWTDLNGDDVAQGGRTFTYNDDGTFSYSDCVYLTADCEINLAQLNPTGAIFGTPAAADRYQGYPRGWNFEQLLEVQHALTRRLSLTASWTRGSDRDLTKTVNQFRQDGDYVPVQVFNPIDGTPITVWSIKDTATQTRLNTAGANVSYVEPSRSSVYQQMSVEFRMRPYAGAQIFGGFTMDRDDAVNCGSSVGFVTNPADERFCDDYDLSGIDDHGQFEQAVGLTDLGGRTPWARDFRVGVSLPMPWYGLTMGISYLNNDTGGITPTYSIAPGSGATGTRYPDGLSIAPINPADPRTGSASFSRKIASVPAPACPTAYGCVPGGFVLPTGSIATSTGSFILPTGSTLYTINLYPEGRIRRERLNQVDVKLSKTFHVANVSILPTFEAYNLFNEDTIFGWASGTYATTGGNYLVPAATLQSRIIGFGAQVRW